MTCARIGFVAVTLSPGPEMVTSEAAVDATVDATDTVDATNTVDATDATTSYKLQVQMLHHR